MKKIPTKSKKRVLFISLGCDKNLVDSEMMLGMLMTSGYEITDDEREADIVVVNTCCFIGDAKEESVNTILEMAELRKNGDIEALLVAGCLAQRYREEIQTEIPEVDAILGTMAAALVEQVRTDAGHNAGPSYAIIDSQSVKTTSAAEKRGIDGGKNKRTQTAHCSGYYG